MDPDLSFKQNILGCLQALSNTVWGFSKLEVVHEKLLDAVAAMALKKLPYFNGQNIANTVSFALPLVIPQGHCFV